MLGSGSGQGQCRHSCCFPGQYTLGRVGPSAVTSGVRTDGLPRSGVTWYVSRRGSSQRVASAPRAIGSSATRRPARCLAAAPGAKETIRTFLGIKTLALDQRTRRNESPHRHAARYDLRPGNSVKAGPHLTCSITFYSRQFAPRSISTPHTPTPERMIGFTTRSHCIAVANPVCLPPRSTWVMLNTEKRRAVRIPDEMRVKLYAYTPQPLRRVSTFQHLTLPSALTLTLA